MSSNTTVNTIGTLENLAAEKIAKHLLTLTPEGAFVGESMPGFLNQLLSPELTELIWKAVLALRPCSLRDSSFIHLTKKSSEFSLVEPPSHSEFPCPLLLTIIRPFYTFETLTTVTIYRLTDSLARELTDFHFPNLQQLKIEDSSDLTDEGLSLIRMNIELETLVIKSCENITWNGLIKAFVPAPKQLKIENSLKKQRISPRIEEIFPANREKFYMNGSNSWITLSMSPDQVPVLLLPKLTSLTVENNSKINDDNFLNALSCVTFPNLREINFSFTLVTEDGLQTIALNLGQSLEVLDVSFCKINFSNLYRSHRNISWEKFHNLTYLSLSGASFDADQHIQSKFLKSIFQNCSKLNFLSLRGCHLKDLSAECKELLFTQVKEIDLSYNEFITGDILNVDVEDASTSIRTESLHLSGTGVKCPNYNNFVLRNSRLWSSLKRLTLDGTEISPDFVLQLLKQKLGAHLVEISLKFCRSLKDTSLLNIIHEFHIDDEEETQETHAVFANGLILNMEGTLCSQKMLEKFQTHFRYFGIVVHPAIPNNIPDNDHTSVHSSESSDDDADSFDEDQMKMFVKHVEELDGSEQRTTTPTSESSTTEDNPGLTEEDINHHRHLIETYCCKCAVCCQVHWKTGLFTFPKIRYSKRELLSLRRQNMNQNLDSKEED